MMMMPCLPRPLRPARSFALAAAIGLAATASVTAAVSYATPGALYSQDFDSLPNSPTGVSLGNSPVGWTDDNAAPGAGNFSIPGWYLFHPLPLTEGGANGNQRMRIGAGSANTGAFMSYGSDGNTDRALGDLGSNTLAAVGADIFIALRLTNDTGATLDSFTLAFAGEQWRDGGNATPVAQSMTFAWSNNATSINDGGATFNSVPTLTFDSPVFTATAGAVVGDLPANRSQLGTTVTGVNWAPGTDLWLRWADPSHVGNDHGLAIDDLTFSAAVPEPVSTGFLTLALTALYVRRRR